MRDMATLQKEWGKMQMLDFWKLLETSHCKPLPPSWPLLHPFWPRPSGLLSPAFLLNPKWLTLTAAAYRWPFEYFYDILDFFFFFINWILGFAILNGRRCHLKLNFVLFCFFLETCPKLVPVSFVKTKWRTFWFLISNNWKYISCCDTRLDRFLFIVATSSNFKGNDVKLLQRFNVNLMTFYHRFHLPGPYATFHTKLKGHVWKFCHFDVRVNRFRVFQFVKINWMENLVN